MPSRIISAQFPTATSYGLNFFDQTPTNLGSGGAVIGGGWSPGAQLVKTVERPTVVDKWTVLGWGVNFLAATSLIVGGAVAAGVQPFASTRGQLYAGLVRGSAIEGGGGFTGLPPDASLIDLLWDGNTDPPFPLNSSQSAVAPGAVSGRSHRAELPTPLELDVGDSLQIGFWLTPTLGQNIRLWFYQAGYTIVYDPTT